jgi:hypothetical protein
MDWMVSSCAVAAAKAAAIRKKEKNFFTGDLQTMR